jgi:hypothetical protein
MYGFESSTNLGAPWLKLVIQIHTFSIEHFSLIMNSIFTFCILLFAIDCVTPQRDFFYYETTTKIYDSILDAAYVRPQFSLSRFAKNVQKAGLFETLVGEGSFTVFAPRNVAFFDVDFSGLNKEALKKVIERHIVPSEIRFEAMKEGTTELTSMGGSKITLTKEGNKGTITTPSGTAKITKFDILKFKLRYIY